jgi:hypothetical protein
VANSPAADLTGMVTKAQRGTLTDDQMPLFLSIVESTARLHPEVNRGDFRSGAAANSTPADAERLRRVLAKWALPQGSVSAPLSVVYGGTDTYIDISGQFVWLADRFAGKPAINQCP